MRQNTKILQERLVAPMAYPIAEEKTCDNEEPDAEGDLLPSLELCCGMGELFMSCGELVLYLGGVGQLDRVFHPDLGAYRVVGAFPANVFAGLEDREGVLV